MVESNVRVTLLPPVAASFRATGRLLFFALMVTMQRRREPDCSL
jgi:hypothetical protein